MAKLYTITLVSEDGIAFQASAATKKAAKKAAYAMAQKVLKKKGKNIPDMEAMKEIVVCRERSKKVKK